MFLLYNACIYGRCKSGMNIFSFSAHFGTEESCREHFKTERDKVGIVCRRCGHTEHYWIKNRWSSECNSCHHRSSLRSGTVMGNPSLSYLVWYKTIFLPDTIKKDLRIRKYKNN